MGDVEERRADLALDACELRLQFLAQAAVQARQRFVEEEDTRLRDERAGEGDPLALPAAERRRVTLAEPTETDEVEHVGHPTVALVAVDARPGQPVGDVLADAHVGEQHEVLEDEADVPPVRGAGRHVAPVEKDASLGWRLQPCEHPERRRLPAAGGAEEGDELAGRDRQRDVVDRRLGAEHLRQAARLEHRLGLGRPVGHPARFFASFHVFVYCSTSDCGFGSS